MASKNTQAKKPAAKQASKPSAKPAAKKPAAKPASKAKPAAKKPVAKPVAKKPVAKPKPAAKKPAAKPKPAAKKPAAKPKPAAKVPAKGKPSTTKGAGSPAKAASKPVAKATKPAAKVAKAPAKPAKPAAKAPVKQATKPVAKVPGAAAVKPAPGKRADKSQTKPAKSNSPVNSPTPVTPKKPTPTPELVAAEEIKIQPQKPTPFILKQKQRLLDLRDQLTDAFVGVTRDTLRNAPSGSEASGSGMHQGDAGSDAYDRDFALSMLAKEQDALYEIAQALRRVDKGVYGICEISGKKIPQARLEAIPFARLTVECQAEWEKEHGNRRFRPANEVGFGGGVYETDESETVSLDEDED